MTRENVQTTFDYPLTLQSAFERSLQKYSDRDAVRFHGQALTYGELDRRANALANALVDRGVSVGDRVALLMQNRIEFVIGRIAIIKAGAAVLPLNEMLSAEDLEYMLDDSSANAVICGPRFVDTVAEFRDGLDELQLHIAIVDEDDDLWEGFTSFDKLLEQGEGRSPPPAVSEPADLAGYHYTGGTTGQPKPVVFTQDRRIMSLYAHIIELDINEDDNMLITTPLPHAARLFVKSALLSGATVFIRDEFDPADALFMIEQRDITWTYMVPTMIYDLLDHPDLDDTDLSSLRTLVYGSAPITPNRLREGIGAVGPIFKQLYGQTEVPDLISTLGKKEHEMAITGDGDRLLSSAGHPCLMADVKIVDTETGEELPRGEEGEIVAKTPYNMKEYANRPEKTAETMDNGWVHTGDIGKMDENGYIYLLDRKADMIITGGMNVYSTQVEDVLARHPGIQKVAVIGIPHERWGEAVHAVVKPYESEDIDESSVMEFAEEQLADYKRPKSVDFVDLIPQTPYGKMDKKKLRSRYWDENDRSVS